MRLTKYGGLDCNCTVADVGREKYHEIYSEKLMLALEKLSKLEDIEEEMEIELLVILNKVLKQGAWFMLPEYDKNGSKTKPDFIRNVTLGYSKQWYLEYEYFVFHLADYGKTWALTKEELESEYNDRIQNEKA